MNDTAYAIVTPAHNEGAFLRRVIASIAGQTILPVKWVIVDDRSTDDTWKIVLEAADRYPFIEPLRLTGTSNRALGANVVHVFNEGYAGIGDEVPFVVKLDADILHPPNYFATLLERFRDEPELGIASGKTYLRENGGLVLERIPDFHATGPCKTYRTACFKDMGGLIPILGWDILDCAQARRKGWKTRSFRDLHMIHLRMMGSAGGMARANLRYGACYYGIRAHPLFVLAKSIYRALERPYLSSLLIPFGYAQAALKKVQRLNDPDLARFLRKEQLERLLGRTWSQEEKLPRYLVPDEVGESTPDCTS